MDDQSRTQWLEGRRTGIGGSDVAAILGLNDYQSAYSIWADKLGLLPEKEDNEAMRQGRDLEDYVAQRFCEQTGKNVRRNNRMLRSEKYPFMIANIDRQIVGERSGLECKTTSMMNLKKFKNGEYPATYYCQCMHYLAVTGWEKWYLAVLVLNQGFYLYEIERDEDEISALIKAETEFWNLVESNTPPEIDGSKATREALEFINQPDDDKPEAYLYGKENMVEHLFSLKSDKKEIEKNIAQIENQIRADLGGANKGVMHGYTISLQTIIKKSYIVKESSYQRLTIKEKKQNG